MEKTRIRSRKSRRQLLHQYYQYTGFYGFVLDSIKKALLPIILLAAAILLIDRFVFDINGFLTLMTQKLPVAGILVSFFISESLLGLIPPEIFIAWADKTAHPMVYLSLLATLSYIGGLVSYFIGLGITRIPSVHRYLENKMNKHLKNTRKWGGFLIVVGALLPVPFSLSCMAAGIIHFPFKYVSLYGTLRFLRFFLYALVIFRIV